MKAPGPERHAQGGAQQPVGAGPRQIVLHALSRTQITRSSRKAAIFSAE